METLSIQIPEKIKWGLSDVKEMFGTGIRSCIRASVEYCIEFSRKEWAEYYDSEFDQEHFGSLPGSELIIEVHLDISKDHKEKVAEWSESAGVSQSYLVYSMLQYCRDNKFIEWTDHLNEEVLPEVEQPDYSEDDNEEIDFNEAVNDPEEMTMDDLMEDIDAVE